MAPKSEKKQGHNCPRLPVGSVQFLTPEWRGQGVSESRTMWEAYLRRVQRLRPMPRKISKEKWEV